LIGVFGGSGFYEFIADARPSPVTTPYGSPAAQPVVGTISGVEVAFIPRHGDDHQFPPHLTPFRANVWAMRELGVDRIIATAAMGSLLKEYAPGHFVIPDQIVDRTWGREHTFVSGPEVEHLSFADPYHPGMRQAALQGLKSTGAEVHEGGTVVVVHGPRFSTRAESAAFLAAGWYLLSMTQMPEAALAGEAGMAYVGIGVITDYDVGLDGAPPVTHDAVLRRFAESVDTLKAGIAAMAPAIDAIAL
jgi:5'-methylthioadenosine phosphorylase